MSSPRNSSRKITDGFRVVPANQEVVEKAAKHTWLTGHWQRAATAATPDRFSQLTAAHLDTVFAYCRRRLPTRDDAEDATAETFAAAFAARLPRDESDHRAFLLGIARHKVADLLRRRYRRNETTLDTLADQLDTALTPEQHALKGEDAAQLRRAVLALPPLQREALLLKYTDDLSVAEVARALRKSEKAVQSLLQRARATLKETLR